MFSSQAHCGNRPNWWKNARSSLLKFLNIDGTWATTTARQMIEKDLTQRKTNEKGTVKQLYIVCVCERERERERERETCESVSKHIRVILNFCWYY